MWIGHRERLNELLMNDPSLLSPEARPYANYPGGHHEACPDGLKNFLIRFYTHIAGKEKPNISTFEDGLNELATCEAILVCFRSKK